MADFFGDRHATTHSALSLPPPPIDLQELAEWFAEHEETIREIRSLTWQASRRLSEAVREHGPFRTRHGVVEIQPDGTAWDEEAVAREFPSLVRQITVQFGLPTVEAAERAMSIVLEELPDAEVKTVGREIDKTGARRMERVNPRVKELKELRGRLGVRQG